jgi:hypothetical protein
LRPHKSALEEGEALTDFTGRRARSLEEWAVIRSRLLTAEDVMAAIGAYRPEPTDVVIAPYGKCGTTWLQQIFHALRTRGDMDFDDICRVIPWIETAVGLGLDINTPQHAAPRGFKSHLPYEALPKGARYVVSMRDPKDALPSFYHFMVGWMIEPGAIPIEAFAQAWIHDGVSGPISYWMHLLSWWAQRDNPNVLIFSYEHMCEEPEAHIRKLAAFCGIALDADLLALTLERSSIGYMLAHKDRFDEAMLRRLSEERCGLPPGSDSSKVRKGGAGGHKAELPAGAAAALDEIWRAQVASLTGFADYAALEADIRRRLVG